ncbi:MAG: UDP-glucose/GDP-mannose dehydrogenase family protein [Parcubacteria group bacterium]|nr:UDP-glucose/GDP-mannose dehydrogenase family protein [Parcubacteria group bacterium]
MGGGFVGSSVASFFGGSNVYDKFKLMDPLEEVLKQELIFVCVPTPYENGFNRSALDDVFEKIGSINEPRIVVIKSTCVPGTTDYFQQKYQHLKVLFNPEFLTQATAEQDFKNPDKQLVGYTSTSRDVSRSVLDMLPHAPYKKIMSAASTELVKYAVNTFYATKVVFGNMLYDLCQSLGVDYNEVKEAFVSDQRIIDSHFDVLHGGYRGYGGKCLPKDLLALVELGKKKGVDVGLLEKVDEMNQKYRTL